MDKSGKRRNKMDYYVFIDFFSEIEKRNYFYQ